MEIVTKPEVFEWLRLDYDDPTVDSLIQSAYDIAEDAVDGFTEKLKSAKFKRKLKLFMLNCIVNMYDRRGMTSDTDDKLQYINATMLMQLQYGTYSETDP